MNRAKETSCRRAGFLWALLPHFFVFNIFNNLPALFITQNAVGEIPYRLPEPFDTVLNPVGSAIAAPVAIVD